MNATWRIAVMQIDCRLGEISVNLQMLRTQLARAADAGAKLVLFPECILTGYGFSNRREILEVAQTIPGPATDAIARECQRFGIHAAFGLFEVDGSRLYNACALVGPNGLVAKYRKLHLPCVGADRFTDPGDQPLAVHDLGGLKVGLAICFDCGFPETCRVLALQGADLIALPTNWADKAIKNATLVSRVRAFENHLYFAAINRIGDESGYHYIGHSSIVDFNGDFQQFAEHDRETMLLADLSPSDARQKRIVHCRGEYEIDRVNWRRPDMYGELTRGEVFTGHVATREVNPIDNPS